MERTSDLKEENKELKTRLAEVEETLNAIRSGEVDALVATGPNGDQIFTIQGAETPYRILVEEMNQGALMLIPDGTIVFANTRFAQLSRTPLEQVIGSSWKQFFPPDKSQQLEDYLKNAAPSPLEELNLQAADGSLCPVHLSFRSMSASGVAGFSVIVTDLTERHASENALRKISEKLLEKNGELEAFSYSISHDMRAPLRAMQQYARVFLEEYGDKLPAEPKMYLDRIISSAARLDRLVLDVLAYSQLSNDKDEAGTFDLDKMVRETIEAYPHLSGRDIEVVGSCALVRGYEVALGQCILNLLSNAIKFVPEGVTPSVKVSTESRNGRCRLWVQDNGIGIAPEDQESVFHIFTRLHNNNEYEGTGLGLCMVKKAAEKMGGGAGVESELGKGSRFWIELEQG